VDRESIKQLRHNIRNTKPAYDDEETKAYSYSTESLDSMEFPPFTRDHLGNDWQQPYSPVSEPYTPVSEPYTPGSEPYTPGSEPYTPVSEPYTPVSEPYTPVSEPYTPVSEPNVSIPSRRQENQGQTNGFRSPMITINTTNTITVERNNTRVDARGHVQTTDREHRDVIRRHTLPEIVVSEHTKRQQYKDTPEDISNLSSQPSEFRQTQASLDRSTDIARIPELDSEMSPRSQPSQRSHPVDAMQMNIDGFNHQAYPDDVRLGPSIERPDSPISDQLSEPGDTGYRICPLEETPSEGFDHVYQNGTGAPSDSCQTDFTMTDIAMQDEAIETEYSDYMDEMERLRRERSYIIELLGKDYVPSRVWIELVEAQLNYTIGQTDTLLDALEKGEDFLTNSFPAQNQENEQHLTEITSTHISNYRFQLEESKRNIEERLQELENTKPMRPSRSKKKADKFSGLKRQAEVEMFKLERAREVLHNAPPSESEVRTRLFVTGLGHPHHITGHHRYMTPAQHHKYLLDLRKTLVESSLEVDHLGRLPSTSRSLSGRRRTSSDRYVHPKFLSCYMFLLS
jgi:hypothetical protein